tara:strand:- start:8608 stop:8973 length:366 start_codon:yes stop_codon:yes gene_type:complete
VNIPVRKWFIAAAALMLCTGSASALTVEDYTRLVKLEVTVAHLYISGVGAGLLWANAFDEKSPGRAGSIYCAPPQLSLTAKNYHDIAVAAVGRGDADGTRIGDEPIDYFLLQGMIATFPCH